VLADLTLDVSAARCWRSSALGCGKTTVLKVIAGLVAVDRGDVWFGDLRITGVAAERRGIRDGLSEATAVPAHDRGGERRLRSRDAHAAEPTSRPSGAIDDAMRSVQLEGFGEAPSRLAVRRTGTNASRSRAR